MPDKKWLKGTKNLTITLENDDGDKCEVYFAHDFESWFQNGPYLADPEFLTKLGK